MTARMPTVRTSDHRFHYEERGSGPPLVLVHGTGDDAASFAQAAALLSTTHRVIAFDRRGFTETGGTPPRKRGYVRSHADDLAAVMRELGAVPGIVVGWSYGGIIALDAAASHPSVVRCVVLYEPPLHAKKHMKLSAARGIVGAILLGKLGMPRRGARYFFRWATQEPSGECGFDALDEKERDAVLANASSVLAELEAGTGEDLGEDELAQVKAPLGMILGGRTKPIFVDAVDRLAKSFPSAPVVRIPDGDHVTPVRQPDLFVSAVREVISHLDR